MVLVEPFRNDTLTTYWNTTFVHVSHRATMTKLSCFASDLYATLLQVSEHALDSVLPCPNVEWRVVQDVCSLEAQLSANHLMMTTA